MTKASIYTAPECPHSKRLKEFLEENGVDFEEKSVLDSKDLLDELFEVTDQRAVPATIVDGEVFIGFGRRAERRLRRKLGA
ncbi:MAG: glutaredoxin family protein [Candidatus Thorarchaeota archaeon]|jgi:glutaredoxin